MILIKVSGDFIPHARILGREDPAREKHSDFAMFTRIGCFNFVLTNNHTFRCARLFIGRKRYGAKTYYITN